MVTIRVTNKAEPNESFVERFYTEEAAREWAKSFPREQYSIRISYY